MKKYIVNTQKFALKTLERASRYIVISGLIAAVFAQLTLYSQWDVMVADMGQTLISVSGREVVNAEEVQREELNLSSGLEVQSQK